MQSTFFNIPGSGTSDVIQIGNYTILPYEYNAGDSGSDKTINLSTAAAQRITMTDNCIFTLSNPQSGAAYILNIFQDNFTMAWPGNVIWMNNGEVAPTEGASGGRLLVNLYYDGSNFLASYVTNY